MKIKLRLPIVSLDPFPFDYPLSDFHSNLLIQAQTRCVDFQVRNINNQAKISRISKDN